jgi:hypothetical protein
MRSASRYSNFPSDRPSVPFRQMAPYFSLEGVLHNTHNNVFTTPERSHRRCGLQARMGREANVTPELLMSKNLAIDVFDSVLQFRIFFARECALRVESKPAAFLFRSIGAVLARKRFNRLHRDCAPSARDKYRPIVS